MTTVATGPVAGTTLPAQALTALPETGALRRIKWGRRPRRVGAAMPATSRCAGVGQEPHSRPYPITTIEIHGGGSMKFRRFAASSASVCFFALAPAFAATIVVNNDAIDCPKADFTSIQTAVHAAQPGDKILVCPGTYTEAVLVDKPDLRIEAMGAAGSVVLQGTPAHEIGFHLLNTSGVLLEGFTVQGFRGANIRVENGSGNKVRKNISTQLIGPAGSSIHVMNSSANIVEHNTAVSNCANCSGIGVAESASSDNIVRHNEAFLNGSAGVQAIRSGPRNVLFGNRSYSNAIGIRNTLGSHGNVIENNYVFANVAATTGAVEGGIIVGASNLVTVRNNRSERNAAFGIRLQNGAAENLVEKNEVVENVQDGIRFESAVPTGVAGPIIANTVQLNLIRGNGRDGIRLHDPMVTQNTIERNVIRESGEHDAHDDGTANMWIENKCETENRPDLCKNPS